MGRAPAYIFVVRHGNRLDAANKQWHLQSPTPYDPPLTYSGWNQARAVGQRIGEILREREDLSEATNAAGNDPPRKRRKFKVVLHSSPFLRCVQTSVGISAGLASMPEPTRPDLARTPSTHSSANPRLRSSTSVDVLPANPDPTTSRPFSDLPTPPDGDSRPTTPKQYIIEKTVLRLDAFLGEWLTPSYFELITPPPGSSLMLASAKAGLLRKEDYSSNPNFASYNNAAAGAQTWSPSPTTITPVSSSLDNVASLAEALRRAGRSDSVTSVTSNGESRLLAGGPYVAPVPAYAISHNAEIPSGYVPHARDNCCHVDYQWDSMRGTLDWGDGGKLGEEWTSMHKRFRKGLQKLVDWYSTAEHPTQMVTKERRGSVTDDYVSIDEGEDVEVESVVIIVSHGAGCNALIGAITHKPVLTDVGLASLTQAVRKPGVGEIEVEIDSQPRASSNGSNTVSHDSGLVAIHEYYALKLLASSEHLANGRISRAPSVTAAAKPPSRGRLGSLNFTSSPLSGIPSRANDSKGLLPSSSIPSETRNAPATTATTGMLQASGSSSQLATRLGLNTNGLGGGGITVGSGMTSFLNKAPAAGGLWSPLRSTLDTPEEEEDDFLPNFGSFDNGLSASVANKSEDPALAAPATPQRTLNVEDRDRTGSTVSPRTNAISNYSPMTKVDANHDEERDYIRPLRQLGSGAGGLWGSPRPLSEEEIPRDVSSPKRRWTVNERGIDQF